MWRHKRDAEGRVERDAQGQLVMESNTRLVKWSDGTMQLMVGPEAYDVSIRPSDRSYLFLKQSPKDATTLLECQGEIASKIQFQPASVTSEVHKKLTTKVRLENIKTARIREIATVHDPEQKEEGKSRSAKRRLETNRVGGSRYRHGKPRASMQDASYLEFDQDSVSAIKSRFRSGGGGGGGGGIDAMSSEDSDSLSDTGLPANRGGGSSFAADASSEDGLSSEDEASQVHRRKKPRRQADSDSE